MEQQEVLFRDQTDAEKVAYLAAIASIATADRSASEEEMEYIESLAESADLSEDQKRVVLNAATNETGEDLKQHLDTLKGSDLRFSLLTDLIAFANSDKNYTSEEKTNVEKIAQYLNIDQQQYSVLDQFVKKTADANVAPEEISKPSFLSSLGMEDKMKSAGINSGSLLKTVISIAGPMLLANMFRRRSGGGGLGGMLGGGGGLGGMLGGGGLGGMLGSGLGNASSGGLGGMLGGALGGGGGMGGGIGSVISMLNGGRGMGSTGGLLGRILGGRGGF